jgi:hypothetical protein
LLSSKSEVYLFSAADMGGDKEGQTGCNWREKLHQHFSANVWIIMIVIMFVFWVLWITLKQSFYHPINIPFRHFCNRVAKIYLPILSSSCLPVHLSVACNNMRTFESIFIKSDISSFTKNLSAHSSFV